MDPNQTITNPPQPAAAPANVPIAPKSGGRIKKILLFIFILILLSSASATAYFFGKPLLFPSKTPDCQNYSFSLSENGSITLTNKSNKQTAAQQARVLIESSEVSVLDVPELNPTESKTLGIISLPEQTFSWEIAGSIYCSNSGIIEITPKVETTTSRCELINVYDADWNLLTFADLSTLAPKDIVRFAVLGTTTQGEFDKAKFTINGVEQEEVVNQRPGSNEFYQEYSIPAQTKDFVVKAQIHHSQLNEWY